MKIEKVSVTQINAAPYNPRIELKQGDPAYEKLKNSIATFGYVDPIVWNSRTGNLVGGHQRLSVLLEQGVSEVEVSVVDLALEDEKALNLGLNKICGDWDQDKLAVLLDEMCKLPDFDMGLTGFDAPEISILLDNYFKPKQDELTIESDSMKNPITQKGDLILIGTHKILCGDSSNPDDIAKLIGSDKMSLLFTDPPYNVDYYAGARPVPEAGKPKPTASWDKIHNDNMDQEQYEVWLKKIFTNINPYLDKGAPLYVWNGHKQFGPMHKMLIELGVHISCVITWAKESFALGYGDYNQQTEFCLYGWKEDNGAHNWYGPVNESTLWQVNRESIGTYVHPTQKPTILAERAIKNSSKRGDIVLDAFLGSGTTLVAAEGLGRACYGLEIDPSYCDVIVRRYINCVGKDKVSDDIRKRYSKEDI